MKYGGALFIALLTATLSLNSAAQNSKIYTWTDSKGVVHFGERPPSNVQAKLVKTRAGRSEPTPLPASSANASSRAGIVGTVEPPKSPERCDKARANLNLINTVARIRTENAEGVMVYLTEEDKANERTRLERIIAEECE